MTPNEYTALRESIRQERLILTEGQLAALEKAKADKEAHREFDTECPGYCGAQDTFDTAYAADRVVNATRIVVEIVRKLPDQIGFTVLPRRWVVERLFAWLGRNRRLAKDLETTIASATAFLCAASVMLLTRRIARS